VASRFHIDQENNIVTNSEDGMFLQLTFLLSPMDLGWLFGWLVGWLIDWLVGWLVGWLVC
jgi:hypothetical protein